MAFSKMAGLDVIPRKPSSLIIFFRSPLSKMLRRMKSSHGDWPYASKPFKGFAPCAALMLGMVVVVVMLLLLYTGQSAEDYLTSVQTEPPRNSPLSHGFSETPRLRQPLQAGACRAPRW